MRHTMVLVANHGSLGGGEIMLLRCADALRELGVTPVIVAPLAPPAVADAARAGSLDVVTYAPGLGGPAAQLWALRRAVARVRRHHPGAITWCHGSGPVLATAGMSRRVVHLHRVPDALHCAPLLVACAGALDVLVPSQDTLSRLPWPLQRRGHVLSNWTEDIPRGPRQGAEVAGQILVGFLGRPAPGKGIGDLVAAVKHLGGAAPELNIVLRVAGDPLFVSAGHQDDVQQCLASLGERAQQVGWVDRQAFLSDIDVLVCPSRWPEAFGLAAAEAMAAGVPVVVSGAGALPEVVGDQHPYVALEGDPADLSRVLLNACRELNTPRGEHSVQAARARWERLWGPAPGRARVADALRRWRVM